MIPYLTLASHIVLGVVLLSLALGVNKSLLQWVSRHSLHLGLLISLSAIAGSLYYSNVVGFPPCDLCWWQRVFIYPALPLFAVALWKKDFGVFKYITALAAIASLISIYHLFVQMGGNSILPCSASASCDRLYVYEFGYVTIPAMALTVSAAFLILAWVRRKYE